MSFQSDAESTDLWQREGEFIARHLAMWMGSLADHVEAPERLTLLYQIRACVDARDIDGLDPLIRSYALANLTSGDPS